MPPLLKFLIHRLLFAAVSLILITFVLYAGSNIMPLEARAALYMSNSKRELTEEQRQRLIDVIIQSHRLEDPLVVQYVSWLGTLASGSWGYSPVLHGNVLPSLLRRTPVTLEIALFSLLLMVPLGFSSGLIAGWQPYRRFDKFFRSLAYVATSNPPFILSIVMLSVFYVSLGWFFPGRLDTATSIEISRETFIQYTGMLTLDSLLNGRLDIFLSYLRHLTMPIFTLSLYHWATLGRVTRVTVIAEKSKAYLMAARARGVSSRKLLWHHAARAILAPSLTTIGLAAANIVTGIFVVEIIFDLNGVSEVIVLAMRDIPDAAATMGFAIYSVVMVLGLMVGIDLLQAFLDPRVREEVMKA